MKRRKILISCILLCSLQLSTLLAASMPEPKSHWDNTQTINEDWLYLERDSRELPSAQEKGYQEINLPHTWNNIDVLEQFEYRRGGSWYRKYLTLDDKQLEQRLYLRFGAAGQEARVYLNGEELTYHNGGYSAFSVEIGEVAKVGENVVDVWVSNKRETYIAPQTADFNFYGGLYRSVELIEAPETSFSRNHFGGPGVRVWSDEVSQESGNLKLLATLDNGAKRSCKVTLKATLKDQYGVVVSKGSTRATLAPSKSTQVDLELPKIKNPSLWSPEEPTLYSLSVELVERGTTIDQMQIDHGFRFYEFTTDKGFFLNGKPYKLHGVSRHQDFYGEGNAIPLHRHYDDIVMMKEAGINWLRMAHYQQDDYIVSLCDQLGILVWEEIPWVNQMPKDPAFGDALQSMLQDLIEQHFNHTSVIVWGLGNEVWMDDRGDGKATIHDLLSRLNEFAHNEDHTRKTIFVNGDNDRPLDYGVYEVADLFGYNLYRGWYQQDYLSLTARVEEIRSRMPNTPLFISEFGAGSDLRIHSEEPTRQDFSTEYQNDYLESHFLQLNKMDWLCGFNEWVWADFGAAHRGDSMPHINQKGLVTFDREKKDSFYIFKSLYSTEPVVYLESPSWSERVGEAEKVYRVFTNMKEVELLHNGRSLGTQKSGFEWTVTLSEGRNELLARGVGYKEESIEQEHGFAVNYSRRANNYTIQATNPMDGCSAELAIDADPKTYFKADKESQITLDLQSISLVNGVSISMYEPEKGGYSIIIEVSADGHSWEEEFNGRANARTSIETFMFDKQQEIRYIRVTGKRSKSETENGYYEIKPLISFEKSEKNLYEKIGAGE